MPPSPAPPPDPVSPAAPSSLLPPHGLYLEPTPGAASPIAPVRSSPIRATPPSPQASPALAAAVRSSTFASTSTTAAAAPPSFHSNPVSVYVFLESHPHDPLVPSLRPLDGALLLRAPKRMTHPLAAPSPAAATAASATAPVSPIGGAAGVPTGRPGVVVAVNVALVTLKLRVSRTRRRRVRRMIAQQRQQQKSQVADSVSAPFRQQRTRSLRRRAPDASSRSRSRPRPAFADVVAGLFGTASRPPVFGATSDTATAVAATAPTSGATSGHRSGRRPSFASSAASKAPTLPPPKFPRPDLASAILAIPQTSEDAGQIRPAAATATEDDNATEPVPRPSVGSLESTATSASADDARPGDIRTWSQDDEDSSFTARPGPPPVAWQPPPLPPTPRPPTTRSRGGSGSSSGGGLLPIPAEFDALLRRLDAAYLYQDASQPNTLLPMPPSWPARLRPPDQGAAATATGSISLPTQAPGLGGGREWRSGSLAPGSTSAAAAAAAASAPRSGQRHHRLVRSTSAMGTAASVGARWLTQQQLPPPPPLPPPPSMVPHWLPAGAQTEALLPSRGRGWASQPQADGTRPPRVEGSAHLDNGEGGVSARPGWRPFASRRTGSSSRSRRRPSPPSPGEVVDTLEDLGIM
ncbi:hypothetical protein HK405_005272 [Cladochytrium tenue]|nr:hypothetical protein HK405_005272 [Cladochytrium tenue]